MLARSRRGGGVTQPIKRDIKLLGIVNRGEAAMRCIRSAKALRAREGSDLQTLALFTQADREAPFVRYADRALRLAEPRGAVAAYLDHDALVRVLSEASVDAVWPGWGFSAEHPEFVDKLAAAGIRFLGPSAEAMRRLGDKIASKELAESVDVPVTAWSGGALADYEAGRVAAERVGYPLVVKASAGGGGRGIRFVNAPEDLEEAMRSAGSEAVTAFGDGRLFLESAVRTGRHIEVQILADQHGHVFALGSRDCSVQRRFQKVLEEAPPPGLAPEVQKGLLEAAVRIASSVGYSGAGTVEFLVDGDRYYFLEMNPRLQVEHGITEEITGLDLVELQIRVARGEDLGDLSFRQQGHAIEARVCAEDPDAGFIPSPGRIARFDPVLGPKVRIDTGVAPGTDVPDAFDSLIAKVITKGDDRHESTSRLRAALADFDLVIEGGATNKGYLLEVLEDPEYQAGGVDVGWLDRFGEAKRPTREHAAPALVAASILTYQYGRNLARLNFFADASNPSPDRVPASVGQEVDLSYAGEQYPLEVYALGGWRYRVYSEGSFITATLREEGPHRARLEIGDTVLPILYDTTEAGLRIEVAGLAHQFGWQTVGQVRAATPAMVIGVHVSVGDRVDSGQPLGILEAMKMEIGFDAPVAGVVTDVGVRAGQQVKAGEVLLVIDPVDDAGESVATTRISLPEVADPLALLFGGEKELGSPDLARAASSEGAERHAALASVREELSRVILGYDINPTRAVRLIEFLEAPVDESLPAVFLKELAEIADMLAVAADIEQLFVRSPRASVSGELGPSNSARFRMFVRRLRAGGSGIAPEFLELVSKALAHYGIEALEHSDALERAVLRLIASQAPNPKRQEIVSALIRQAVALTRAGVPLVDNWPLADALSRLSDMRGLVSDAVADAAIDARYEIFERPGIDARLAETGRELDAWLAAAETEATEPPQGVLRDLADAPRLVFDRIGGAVADPDPRRRGLALEAHLRRFYTPVGFASRVATVHGGVSILRAELDDRRIVLGAACDRGNAAQAFDWLKRTAASLRDQHEWPAVAALELIVPSGSDGDAPIDAEIRSGLAEGLPAARVTITEVEAGRPDVCTTFVPDPSGYAVADGLHGVHPEAAERIDLARLARFDLTRRDAPEGLYAFYARSREVPEDERVFVLADVRGRRADANRRDEINPAAFEKAFVEATRAMRSLVASTDTKRRLLWNRIGIYCGPPVRLDPELTWDLTRRLWPTTRRLGLEKVVVRVGLIEDGAPVTPTEFVITDITGSKIDLIRREPRTRPLEPVSDYERKVVSARSRRLVYPYEIIRMLTGSGAGDPGAGAAIPMGEFEEYDLEPGEGPPRPRRVSGRPFGLNESAIVFGVITAPTDKHPEGLTRVIVLSDPTIGMGALGAPECDRIEAAINLAEDMAVPLEWLPVSAGAKIAMDSGTENLDATARVVKRIVEFTQSGGAIHLIVQGVNVGAQSYWNALATMLMHTRGVLIMTPGASMVLTGRAALEASGAVAAEDEVAIGGFERIMGPNGQAQYFASDLADAYRILYQHYRYSYVAPGERAPRLHMTKDRDDRSLLEAPCEPDTDGFRSVGEIFEDETNPGRKKPFPMRSVMQALVDEDGGHLERWNAWVGGETGIVWDAHVGGVPITLVGIESRNVDREGYRPLDGPASWSGGTLFPQSSKKVARALNAASGNRPVVVLANLSGFDGSPESMRKLQLEYGAEIARAVVNFDGPLLFLVVSRYHGGAYVVFSQELNPSLRAFALEGSYASVIGGGAAAAVVFTREVRKRAAADERVTGARSELARSGTQQARAQLEAITEEVSLEKQSELAAEFDAVHSVARAERVGSLSGIVSPKEMRSFVVRTLREALGHEGTSR